MHLPPAVLGLRVDDAGLLVARRHGAPVAGAAVALAEGHVPVEDPEATVPAAAEVPAAPAVPALGALPAAASAQPADEASVREGGQPVLLVAELPLAAVG